MTIELLDLHPEPADLRRLVEEGLRSSPRQLPAWLLYDGEGSRLFAAICEQPEYSLTRTELALLDQHAKAMAAAVGRGVMVEFGIGHAPKVSPLLNAMEASSFVALDISRSALQEALEGLKADHPTVSMLGICCDHSQLDVLPAHPLLDGQPLVGFFPGSSLGNFRPDEAVELLGLDQPRDPTLLEAAYDDAAGVSAAFARNLLTRLNRDLQGDIDPTSFSYRARWQPQASRIEMALVSRCDQTLQLAGRPWSFTSGDLWITEHSVKYSPTAAADLALRAGWRIEQRWHDAEDHLSMHLLQPAD